ncbi:MAG TPA: glycosyltransferase family 9 protein [Candidatus Nanopelagicales bacterium]
MLLAGPAVRAIAADPDVHLTFLCSTRGVAAAQLLPGVDRIQVFDAPWILADPPPVRRAGIAWTTLRLQQSRYDAALVLTSFHQSPLPLALLLRMAGVPWIVAASDDYPGSLIDVRVRLDDQLHEAERSAELAHALGFPPVGTHLSVRPDLPDVAHLQPMGRYLVVHPGSDAPARRWPPVLARATVTLLAGQGWQVLVTGSPAERELTAYVAGELGVDLGGRSSLPELAALLRGASAVVVGNTGPAHLAAAVGTPVVSLFAPTVPAERWAPHGVPRVLLGDQLAPCAGTRVRDCAVPGHPCLSSVGPTEVADAVAALVGVAA